jgi:hypothetical protein
MVRGVRGVRGVDGEGPPDCLLLASAAVRTAHCPLTAGCAPSASLLPSPGRLAEEEAEPAGRACRAVRRQGHRCCVCSPGPALLRYCTLTL